MHDMKQEKEEKKHYLAPQLELLLIAAERGYGASWDVDDWELGGDYEGDAD